MNANRKNVPAGVSLSSIQGVSWPMRYVPIQRAKPAMDIARPRTRFGYISLNRTNTTALIDIAVQKTYSKKKVSMNQSGRSVTGRKFGTIVTSYVMGVGQLQQSETPVIPIFEIYRDWEFSTGISFSDA